MKFFLLLPILFLWGCSSYRDIGKPDQSLKGEAAKQEVDRFSLWSKSYLSLNTNLQMGPKAKSYSLESVSPVIKEISPGSVEKLKKFESIDKTKWNIFITAGTLFVLSFVNPNQNQKSQLKWAAIIFETIGISIHLYQINEIRQIPRIYNHDLNEIFFPSISWSKNI